MVICADAVTDYVLISMRYQQIEGCLTPKRPVEVKTLVVLVNYGSLVCGCLDLYS